jgi:hypothetical protein
MFILKIKHINTYYVCVEKMRIFTERQLVRPNLYILFLLQLYTLHKYFFTFIMFARKPWPRFVFINVCLAITFSSKDGSDSERRISNGMRIRWKKDDNSSSIKMVKDLFFRKKTLLISFFF